MSADVFEKINKKVRAGQVSLFVGAGFSLKAGAPSAKHLVNCISLLFPKEYKKGLRYLPLDDIANEYVKFCKGDKQPLIDFISEIMRFKRTDMSDHEALVKIPHFKNIFTTNYDTLLEDSYPEEDIKVVRCDADCSQTDKAVNIYKVHGDVICPEQMVITRADYDSLLCTERNSIVWNRVKDAFASTDVLFLGYSLEDTNMQILLDKISGSLKENRRDVFLMAPDLSEEKIHELASRNIQYINTKAENFLYALTEELKNSVCQDLKDGIVNPAIAVRFLERYGIKTVLEHVDGKIVIKTINPSSQSSLQTLHFTIKANADNSHNLLNFDFEKLGNRGGRLGVPSIVYEKEDILRFERRINGVKTMSDGEVSMIEIGPSVFKDDVIDLVVPEIDFIENVSYKSYRNKDNLVLSLDTPLYYLDFSFTPDTCDENNCTVTTIYKDDYGQYEKAVTWTNLLIALFEGKELLLGGKITIRLNHSLYSDVVQELRKSLTYYKNVHKIEVLRKQTFAKHPKYEEGIDELSSVILHLLAEDTVVERLNMEGRIECTLNPESELPLSFNPSIENPEYTTLRISKVTNNEIVFNEVNFGRILMQKDLQKCHVEKIDEKGGEKLVVFAPDVDHWNVKYLRYEGN